MFQTIGLNYRGPEVAVLAAFLYGAGFALGKRLSPHQYDEIMVDTVRHLQIHLGLESSQLGFIDQLTVVAIRDRYHFDLEVTCQAVVCQPVLRIE